MKHFPPGTTRGHLPVIYQAEAAECGVACLAMLAGYFGLETDLPTMRRTLSVSLKGMNLTQFMNAAQAVGLAGRAVRLELDELRDIRTPCLLHWDLHHYVVLKAVRHGVVIIHDPAVGVRRLRLRNVGMHFTGVAVELTPTPEFQPRVERQRVRLGDLFGRVIGVRGKLAQVLAISLGIELCALLSPLYVQWVVDHALLSGDRDLVTLLALGFGLVALIHVSISGLRSWTLLNLSTSISVQWSTNVFSHLLRLPLLYFEKRHLGDVVSRFEAGGAIQKALTTSFIEALLDGLMVMASLAMMLIYSPVLSMITIGAVTAYALLRIAAYQPLRLATEEQVVLAAKQQTTFLESVRGIQAIKVFGREAYRVGSWQGRLVETTNRALKTQRLMVGYRFVNGLLSAMEGILVVWVGAGLVLGNTFSVGMLFAFVSYKTVFSGRTASLIDKAIELVMLGLQRERLADIVLTRREEPLPQCREQRRSLPAVKVEEVSFRYSDLDPWILKNVSFEIPAGSSVAIVGPSGCGKTTFAKLLLGLHLPTSGRIVTDFDGECHSGRMNAPTTAVMQDDQLFAGSIAENISFFDERPDQGRIERAARAAWIHDDVNLMPMGYHTLIGDMGSALSGGQKQRILLARALYQEPRILVMDEATSHLDVGLERAINQAVKEMNMTRIVITHRPETVSGCDCVVNLGAFSRDL